MEMNNKKKEGLSSRAGKKSIGDKLAGIFIQQYLEGGLPPWSDGYILYRRHYVSRVLSDPGLMARFRKKERLPGGYGVGLDERCVEYPWLISRIDSRRERILDAGGILNHAHILDRPVWKRKKIHILSLEPEQYCYWKRNISYLFEDLRDIPIRNNLYETVVCLSTLEHIGFDGEKASPRVLGKGRITLAMISAMEEMWRVLKPEGRLFLSVPYGKPSQLGYQMVFDEGLLEKILEALKPEEAEKSFFRYSREGWQPAESSDCRESEYVDWMGHAVGHRGESFPVQPDGATAARAVACIRLKKR
jgi:hypothetical protein